MINFTGEKEKFITLTIQKKPGLGKFYPTEIFNYIIFFKAEYHISGVWCTLKKLWQ